MKRLLLVTVYVAVWSILLAAAPRCGFAGAADPQPTDPRPNILFIFADDMCFETIHALGNDEIETPNLDRLARTGVTFTHAYNMGGWHGAVCVASRTMLNTGRFLWRARDCEPRLKDEAAAGHMWSQYLSRGGYETYMTGKWHVQANAQQLFNHTVHIRPGMPRDSKAGYYRPVAGQEDPWKPWDPQFGGFWEGGEHWSEVLAKDAQAYLEQASRQDHPFFMYLAFNAPHDPRQSPKEYVDKYPLDRISIPLNFLPEYPHKDDIGAGTDLRDEQLAPWPRTPYAVQVHRQEYYALITHMDVQIGKILHALEESGKADNTVIFVPADHGLAVGHHGLLGKQNMYEHSLRPPLIVAGPGIPQDKRIDTPVYLQDIMPTTLDLAHIEIPEQVEFKSLLPLIRGERSVQYAAMYAAYRPDMQRMILQGDDKLIYYPRIKQTLLFNLRADPLEMNNLAEDPRFAATREALTRQLQKLQQEMQDPLE